MTASREFQLTSGLRVMTTNGHTTFGFDGRQEAHSGYCDLKSACSIPVNGNRGTTGPLFGEQFIKASTRHGLVAAWVIEPVTEYRKHSRRAGFLRARTVTRTGPAECACTSKRSEDRVCFLSGGEHRHGQRGCRCRGVGRQVPCPAVRRPSRGSLGLDDGLEAARRGAGGASYFL